MAEENSHAQVYALIFDTDILVWLHRGHTGAAHFVNRVPVEKRNISAVSYLELMYGVRDRDDLRSVRAMVADLFAEVVPISESVSVAAGQIMEAHVLAHRLDVSDALIAATALDRHESLATANRKHFKFISGLNLAIFQP